MRIVFSNANDPKERQEYAGLLQKIDAWWQAFEQKRADLDALFSRKSKWDLYHWMDERLRVISPDLVWEFGPALNVRGHRLVITSEINEQLQPLVGLILRRAPSLPGWEFHPYRPAESLNDATRNAEGRIGGMKQNVTVSAAVTEGGRIDLTFLSSDDEQAQTDAYLYAQTLLGDEILYKWIRTIQAVPPPTHGIAESAVALERLKPAVDEMIAGQLGKLPDRPYCALARPLTWSILKLEPCVRPDYVQQQDILIAKTACLEMWTDAHGNGRFSSERFSRFGETFCYVKINGSESFPPGGFSDKTAIEMALDNALKPIGAGCTVGGGTGHRYGYVDLALTKLQSGIEIVRSVLAEKVPKRCWIQFYDSALAQEWIGIHEDSPAPPL